jgi:hypothetical protein
MLTHDCPKEKLKEIAVFSRFAPKKVEPSEKMLQQIANNIDIDKWYFGHFHIDIQLGNKYQCLYKLIKQII